MTTPRTGTVLVVGLGNPGKKYEFTRHNLGYRVADRVRTELGLPAFKRREALLADVAEGKVGSLKVVLARPLTFMNDSGHAVARLKKELRLKPERIWIVHDDKDLQLGDIRLKEGGSSAGHHGIDSLVEQLGSAEFRRYRLGIMAPSAEGLETEKFVLAKFLPEEEPTVRNQIDRAALQLAEHVGGKA